MFYCLHFLKCPVPLDEFFVLFNGILFTTVESSGLYYKHVMIVNDNSSVVSKWSFKLIDGPRVVIYDRHRFIIQAAGYTSSYWHKFIYSIGLKERSDFWSVYLTCPYWLVSETGLIYTKLLRRSYDNFFDRGLYCRSYRTIFALTWEAKVAPWHSA